MAGQTVKPVVTREQLSAYLEEQIFSGQLREGAKLPSERRLAEQFGMSRPVVREVLRGLIERNLIEVMPGRGAYVHRASVTDAAGPIDSLFRRRRATPRDLVEARKMLECEAAALAAARAERGDLEAMERALTEFERARDLLEKVRYDIAFHSTVAQAAYNPVIETMFGSIINPTVELMLRSLGDPTVSRASLPYHREIFEAVRGKDSERARTAMAGHLSVAERMYGGDYDRELTMLPKRELGRLLGDDTTLEDLLDAAGSAGSEDLPGATVQGSNEPSDQSPGTDPTRGD
jgi:GntR family transcriptional repressor for pyruvate dehydrogenase complex